MAQVGDGSVVPFRQQAIENDLQVLFDLSRGVLSDFVGSADDVDGGFQARACRGIAH